MGFDPAKIEHIANASRFLGNMDLAHIRQLAAWKKPKKPFAVIPPFEHIIAS